MAERPCPAACCHGDVDEGSSLGEVGVALCGDGKEGLSKRREVPVGVSLPVVERSLVELCVSARLVKPSCTGCQSPQIRQPPLQGGSPDTEASRCMDVCMCSEVG